MKKVNNKGFSLVELIIVIAIMAILVGVMAPQLIKYIEKSKVAADLSVLNALEVSFAYAISDPEVNEDAASLALINSLVNGVMSLEDIESYNTTKLYETVIDTLGWTDLNQTTYIQYVKSAHLSSSKIYITYYHDINNPVKIWIDNTDITGGRDTSTSLGATIPSSSNKATFDKLVHIGEIY